MYAPCHLSQARNLRTVSSNLGGDFSAKVVLTSLGPEQVYIQKLLHGNCGDLILCELVKHSTLRHALIDKKKKKNNTVEVCSANVMG